MQDMHRTVRKTRISSMSTQDPHRTSASPRRSLSAGRSCLHLPGLKPYFYARPIFLNLPGTQRSGREAVRDLRRGSSAACCPGQRTCTSDLCLHKTRTRSTTYAKLVPYQCITTPPPVRASRSCLRLPGPKPYLYARPALYISYHNAPGCDPYLYERPTPYQCLTMPHRAGALEYQTMEPKLFDTVKTAKYILLLYINDFSVVWQQTAPKNGEGQQQGQHKRQKQGQHRGQHKG